MADQTLTATTADDDVAGFSVTDSGGTTAVTEAGTTDTFTVVLTAQPLTDVVLAVTSGDLRRGHGQPGHVDVHARRLERAADRDRDRRR